MNSYRYGYNFRPLLVAVAVLVLTAICPAVHAYDLRGEWRGEAKGSIFGAEGSVVITQHNGEDFAAIVEGGNWLGRATFDIERKDSWKPNLRDQGREHFPGHPLLGRYNSRSGQADRRQRIQGFSATILSHVGRQPLRRLVIHEYRFVSGRTLRFRPLPERYLRVASSGQSGPNDHMIV